MTRPRRPPARFVVAALVALLAAAAPASGHQAGALDATASGQRPLDPQFFELIRRTVEETHADLLAVEPGMDPDALRGRLLVEAMQLINNATGSGIDPDRLLTLPAPLREDAARIVSLVMGDRGRPGPPTPPPDPGGGVSTAPVRIRPFEDLLGEVLRARFEELTRGGEADPAARLEAEAVALVARAACPSNDPRDLVPEERSYAVSLARRIAGGGEAGPSGDDALQDDLDALAELLRRRNAALMLLEGVSGIDERARLLERFGLDRLAEAIQVRDPSGTIPDPARAQVRAMAELIARGIPVAIRPNAPEEPIDTGSRPVEPSRPPGEVAGIDPALLESAARLALAVDRGLIAAGVDPQTRREALRRFLLEWIARKSGTAHDALPTSVGAEVDRLVEQILAASPGPTTTGPPIVVVPPVVTLPVTPVSVPTVTTPVRVLVPATRHPWCGPGRRP